MPTPTFTLVHQDAFATLSPQGLAPFAVSFTTPAQAVVTVSLYPHLLDRGQISQLLQGGGVGEQPVSEATLASTRCPSTHHQHTIVLTITPRKTSPCGSTALTLPCQIGTCDGVYPLRYTVHAGGRTSSTWSMVALRSGAIRTPLRVVLLVDVNDTTWANAPATFSTLKALAAATSTPLTVATSYHPLTQADFATTATASRWRQIFSNLLSSPQHQAIVTVPAGSDVGSLAANHFSGEVADQLQLSASLIRQVTGRYATGAVFVDGTPNAADMNALNHAGVSHVVIHGTALSPNPSDTLLWGAPETVASSPSVSELAIDDPLSLLADTTSIEPALRATLALSTLSFLHFDAPNAASPRTVIIRVDPSHWGVTFTQQFLRGLSHDPFAVMQSLAPSFSPNLIGSNALPTTWSLASSSVPAWSGETLLALKTLVTQEHAYVLGVANASVAAALASMVFDAERAGPDRQRRVALRVAQSGLNHELSQFRIDNSSITLTGQGTALPITIVSHAHYPVTVVIHLTNASLVFAKGHTFAITLSAPTTVVRVPLRHAYGSDVTLQLSLTTPNGAITLDHTAVQVRIAGTSVVGYLLSFGALFVLAMWWWRSYRRTSSGRHAK